MRLRKSRKQQRGGVLLESLIGMCFLLFLCFALVELFMMIGRQMVMDYSSFYGAKALALGYAGENCYKATRVAASGISGKKRSLPGWMVMVFTPKDAAISIASLWRKSIWRRND